MRTRDFIEKSLRGTTKVQHCSSVYSVVRDNEVTIYSYGQHYPLVRIIDGNAYINSRGYSNTTSKHISWAFSAAAQVVGRDNCYHAPLIAGRYYGSGGFLDKDGIIAGATNELHDLDIKMNAKKRKDTRVYEWLQIQRDRMTATIESFNE